MHDETSASYRFGPFNLDVPEHRLLKDGVPVPLTPKVFTVLRLLVQNRGHLIEKEALLRDAWPDSFVEEGALNRTVSLLRKALGDDGEATKYIETVPKRGYRFVAPVAECGPEQARPAAEGPPSGVVFTPARFRRYATAAAMTVAVLAAAGWVAFSRFEGRRSETTTASAPTHTQVTFTGTAGSPTLSPDGRRMAYVSAEGVGKRLVVQELDGGSPLEVFTAPELGYLRWSPDGSELLLWARGAGLDGVYVIPQLGGVPRRIAGGRFVACWSPDGARVAVTSYLTGRIWLFDSAGRKDRTIDLEGVDWSIWDIDWSAATDRILFVSSDHQARYTIWMIRPDGSDQSRILTEDTEIKSARWAPLGDAIYYSRRENQTVSIRKLSIPSPASEAPTMLVSGLEADGSFALDAGAKRVVYTRAPFHSNLWRLDVDTGRTTELTRGTSLIERPRISPDGGSVVFNVGHSSRASLYTLPISGGTPKRLTFLDSLNVGGAWSPDGSRLAFGSTEGGTPRVWVVDSGGGTPRPLFSNDLSENLDLAWAPGGRILYQRAGNQNYYDVDPETRAERLLVSDSAPGWVSAPVVSPDGRRVAVLWNRHPNRGVWVIDVRDRRETLMYASKAGSIMPIGWSADGRGIFVVEGRNCADRGQTSVASETMTEARILRIAWRGGRVDTVARVPAAEIGRVSMTPDGRRFVYPVFSSRSDVWVIDDFDVSGGIAR